MEISLRRRHAQTVAIGAFSYKIDYVIIFKEILNPEGHSNRITGSKVTAILLNGGFCPLVELHREGSAPAACAAGLFNTNAYFFNELYNIFIRLIFWFKFYK